MVKEKSCGAVVYKQIEGTIQYLLVCHLRDGHWCFPKGHVEEGETEQETALREVNEESGLTVKLIDGFRSSIAYCPQKGVMKDVIFFIGESNGEDVNFQVEEIKDYRWLPFDEAYKLVTYSDSKEVLKEANEFLKK